MAFDPTPISNIVMRRDGTALAVSWASSAPGSTYQVYVNRVLAWTGLGTSVDLPWPAAKVYVDVGVVPLANAETDYSATLAAAPATRAILTWQGGSFESPTLDSFLVYGSLIPGGPVSFVKPLATVPAYDGGIPTNGWGMGGWGSGGWGSASSSYSWTSGTLSPGVWQFAVDPVDLAGNKQSSPATVSITIVGPPNEPAPNAAGQRLTYIYVPSGRLATLHWLASPP